MNCMIGNHSDIRSFRCVHRDEQCPFMVAFLSTEGESPGNEL